MNQFYSDDKNYSTSVQSITVDRNPFIYVKLTLTTNCMFAFYNQIMYAGAAID